MIARGMLGSCALAIAVSFFLLGWPVGAKAASNQITGCEQYCAGSCSADPKCREADPNTGACQLANDVPCEAYDDEFIDLKDGTDLDMNGYDLDCPPPGPVCTRAILMRAANSVVFNSAAGESLIYDKFTSAVQCDKKSGSTVEGITSLRNTNGILDCDTVTNNVVQEGGSGLLQTGIRVNVNAASTIEDNFVDGHDIGIWVWNLGSPTVDHNIIDALDGEVNWGIVNSGNSSATIEDNVVMGAGQDANSKVVSASAGSVSGNICSQDHADCGKCRTDGLCLTPKAPFTFP